MLTLPEYQKKNVSLFITASKNRKQIGEYLKNINHFWKIIIFYRIALLYSVGNITSILAPCKVVLLIENCNPYSKLNLEWSKKDLLRNALLRKLTRLSAMRAKKIRFASDNSKNLIVNLLKIPKDKCITIYHGFQKKETNRRIYKKYKSLLKSNYILSVTAVAPRARPGRPTRRATPGSSATRRSCWRSSGSDTTTTRGRA